jgi:hypothetical protein
MGRAEVAALPPVAIAAAAINTQMNKAHLGM